MKQEPLTAPKVQAPPASDTVLFASVMAVVWAIIITARLGVARRGLRT